MNAIMPSNLQIFLCLKIFEFSRTDDSMTGDPILL